MAEKLSIVINGEKTAMLRGLKKCVPYAVVLPHTLYATDDTIKGLALYGPERAAPFEMSVAEFQQLDFSFVA